MKTIFNIHHTPGLPFGAGCPIRLAKARGTSRVQAPRPAPRSSPMRRSWPALLPLLAACASAPTAPDAFPPARVAGEPRPPSQRDVAWQRCGEEIAALEARARRPPLRLRALLPLPVGRDRGLARGAIRLTGSRCCAVRCRALPWTRSTRSSRATHGAASTRDRQRTRRWRRGRTCREAGVGSAATRAPATPSRRR